MVAAGSPVAWVITGSRGGNVDGAPDLLIGSEWRHASDAGTREIINPATGKVFATVDEATHDDALAAVAAARAAFDAGDWPATPVAERAALLDLSLIHISEPTRLSLVSRMPSSA